MAKYHGKVGFVTFAEVTPGVDREIPVEREYYGDVTRNTKRWENGTQVNDNLQINNQISIVADSYANQNLFAIRYISWMGALWEVTSVDVQHPRLILTIGGVYNGPTSGSASRFGGDDGTGANGQVSTSSELQTDVSMCCVRAE